MPDQQKEQLRPPQEQNQQLGIQSEMHPQPVSENRSYRGSGKLEGKVAIVTGGDSSIGRAVSIYFAKEGADIAVLYLNEHDDAEETRRQIEQESRRCLLLSGDVGDEAFYLKAVERTPSLAISMCLSITLLNSTRRTVSNTSARISWNAPFAPTFFHISTW